MQLASLNDENNKQNTWLKRRQFVQVFGQNKFPENANDLGGIFVLSIKQPCIEAEKYKARFTVQRHKDKEKERIHHSYLQDGQKK